MTSIILCGMIAACAFPMATVSGEDSPWMVVGDGFDYQFFELDGPVHVYVSRMARANANTTLESVVANGELGSGGETVSSMAERMDQSVSQWHNGSGQRNSVVVAVNGSGYTDNAVPKSGMVVSGFYAKRFDDVGGGSGFGWRTDRAAFIGRCVYQDPAEQSVDFPDSDSGDEVQIAGVNVPRGENQLIIYTPQYGENTSTSDGELEIVVEFREQFTLKANPGVIGIVTEIHDDEGSTPIPFDAVVLSASGTAREKLLDNITLNGRIEINQRIQHLDWDCKGENSFSWARTYASMHGDYAVLRDGEVYPKSEDLGATRAQPRTAIAFNEDYVYFIVVDGRTSESVGMSFESLAEFARDELDATWAIAQDGGGSSVMVVNGVVVNNPVSKCYLGAEAYMPLVVNSVANNMENGIPVVPHPTSTPSTSTELNACERSVANSMMMISLQDPVFSKSTFTAYDQVITQSYTLIRTGPGDNFPVIQEVGPDTAGVILPHLGGLNGVLAKGSYWWRVKLDGIEGWVIEPDLLYVSTPVHNLVASLVP